MLLDGVFVKGGGMWGHLLPLLSPASALPALLWHIAADQFRVPLKFAVQSAQAHPGGLDPPDSRVLIGPLSTSIGNFCGYWVTGMNFPVSQLPLTLA